MTELLLTGVAVTLDMVGTTLLGTVTVKLWVDVPKEAPLASSVSRTTLAEPEVADGITSNHESGMVYDAVDVPAATVCVAVWVPNFHVNLWEYPGIDFPLSYLLPMVSDTASVLSDIQRTVRVKVATPANRKMSEFYSPMFMYIRNIKRIPRTFLLAIDKHTVSC